MRASIYILAATALILGQACSPAGGEKRGHEFMPDMVHSTAYEANLYNYYYYNTWGSKEAYKEFVEPREPVAGTIPRGHSGVHYAGDVASRVAALEGFDGKQSLTSMAVPPNGAVPYHYGNTEEERTRAMEEIIDNPFPITTAGLERGKELYTIYCGICHGEKGDGLGYLVREANPARGITGGVYPAAPANMLQQEFYDATNGRYYHSIMYGRNLMGSYADKLSYEERWQVIHYIRSLQAKELGLEYNEDVNTFNNDVPGGPILAQLAAEKAAREAAQQGEGGGHDNDEGHGDDTGHGGENDHDDDHDHNGGH
ncbi:MAG: cytochrome c [Saprospiraceae bacterium]|nr:cytochrome c [Saprospiraceae bacterium]